MLVRANLPPAVAPIIFGIVGLVFAMIGCVSLWNTRVLMQTGERGVANVVDFERSAYRSKGSYLYTTVFAFTPRGSSEEVRVKDTKQLSTPVHELGEKLPIIYPINDPGKARIDSFMSVWGFGALITGFGALFLIIAGAGAWYLWPQLRSRT